VWAPRPHAHSAAPAAAAAVAPPAKSFVQLQLEKSRAAAAPAPARKTAEEIEAATFKQACHIARVEQRFVDPQELMEWVHATFVERGLAPPGYFPTFVQPRGQPRRCYQNSVLDNYASTPHQLQVAIAAVLALRPLCPQADLARAAVALHTANTRKAEARDKEAGAALGVGAAPGFGAGAGAGAEQSAGGALLGRATGGDAPAARASAAPAAARATGEELRAYDSLMAGPIARHPEVIAHFGLNRRGGPLPLEYHCPSGAEVVATILELLRPGSTAASGGRSAPDPRGDPRELISWDDVAAHWASTREPPLQRLQVSIPSAAGGVRFYVQCALAVSKPFAQSEERLQTEGLQAAETAVRSAMQREQEPAAQELALAARSQVSVGHLAGLFMLGGDFAARDSTLAPLKGLVLELSDALGRAHLGSLAAASAGVGARPGATGSRKEARRGKGQLLHVVNGLAMLPDDPAASFDAAVHSVATAFEARLRRSLLDTSSEGATLRVQLVRAALVLLHLLGTAAQGMRSAVESAVDAILGGLQQRLHDALPASAAADAGAAANADAAAEASDAAGSVPDPCAGLEAQGTGPTLGAAAMPATLGRGAAADAFAARLRQRVHQALHVSFRKQVMVATVLRSTLAGAGSGASGAFGPDSAADAASDAAGKPGAAAARNASSAEARDLLQSLWPSLVGPDARELSDVFGWTMPASAPATGAGAHGLTPRPGGVTAPSDGAATGPGADADAEAASGGPAAAPAAPRPECTPAELLAQIRDHVASAVAKLAAHSALGTEGGRRGRTGAGTATTSSGAAGAVRQLLLEAVWGRVAEDLGVSRFPDLRLGPSSFAEFVRAAAALGEAQSEAQSDERGEAEGDKEGMAAAARGTTGASVGESSRHGSAAARDLISPLQLALEKALGSASAGSEHGGFAAALQAHPLQQRAAGQAVWGALATVFGGHWAADTLLALRSGEADDAADDGRLAAAVSDTRVRAVLATVAASAQAPPGYCADLDLLAADAGEHGSSGEADAADSVPSFLQTPAALRELLLLLRGRSAAFAPFGRTDPSLSDREAAAVHGAVACGAAVRAMPGFLAAPVGSPAHRLPSTPSAECAGATSTAAALATMRAHRPMQPLPHQDVAQALARVPLLQDACDALAWTDVFQPALGPLPAFLASSEAAAAVLAAGDVRFVLDGSDRLVRVAGRAQTSTAGLRSALSSGSLARVAAVLAAAVSFGIDEEPWLGSHAARARSGMRAALIAWLGGESVDPRHRLPLLLHLLASLPGCCRGIVGVDLLLPALHDVGGRLIDLEGLLQAGNWAACSAAAHAGLGQMHEFGPTDRLSAEAADAGLPRFTLSAARAALCAALAGWLAADHSAKAAARAAPGSNGSGSSSSSWQAATRGAGDLRAPDVEALLRRLALPPAQQHFQPQRTAARDRPHAQEALVSHPADGGSRGTAAHAAADASAGAAPEAMGAPVAASGAADASGSTAGAEVHSDADRSTADTLLAAAKGEEGRPAPAGGAHPQAGLRQAAPAGGTSGDSDVAAKPAIAAGELAVLASGVRRHCCHAGRRCTRACGRNSTGAERRVFCGVCVRGCRWLASQRGAGTRSCGGPTPHVAGHVVPARQGRAGAAEARH